MISTQLSIPVIAHGGAGNIEHIQNVITNANADAVSIASVLHYKTIEEISKDGTFENEGNLEFLKSGLVFSKIAPTGLPEIKSFLYEKKIACRYNNMAEVK